MAAAWSGLNPAIPSTLMNDPTILSGALKGLDWWFEHDYTSDDCIGLGGKEYSIPKVSHGASAHGSVTRLALVGHLDYGIP